MSQTNDEQVANDLAQWINTTPLPPDQIHPVYAAHVLLCELLRERRTDLPDPPSALGHAQDLDDNRLRFIEQRANDGHGVGPDDALFLLAIVARLRARGRAAERAEAALAEAQQTIEALRAHVPVEHR